MNLPTFEKYLKFIRNLFNEKTINMLLDQGSSHISLKSFEIAQNMDINLFYIPAGFTDEYQPLDISVFGSLKAMCAANLRSKLRLATQSEIEEIERKEIEDSVRTKKR